MSRFPLKTCLGGLFTLVCCGATFADTITLKSGEKLEGVVTKTTDTTIEAEIKVSASITDSRVFQMSDIASIDKADPAEAAFALIKDLKPGPNSLSLEDYDKLIAGKIQAFLIKHGTSSHVDTVKAILKTFLEDQARVKAGEMKINGTWFTADQVAKDKYQISALLLFQQIQASAAAGDVLGALNQYSTLEKNYKGARVLPDAVDSARKLLPSVQREIDNRIAILKNDLAERQQGLLLTPDYKKPALIAAAKAEEAQTKALLDAAQKSGVVWTPIYPRSARSIEDLRKTLTAETTRLAALKTDDMRASLKANAAGRVQLQGADLIGAAASFQEAAKLWPDNAENKDNTLMLAAAKATPTPTPVKVVVTPKPTRTPAAVAAAAAATAAAAAAAEQKPFLMTIPGAITLLTAAGIIGAIVSFIAKSKGRKG